jgi:Domain of unknown function (DUF222)/HNH endonuclease
MLEKHADALTPDEIEQVLHRGQAVVGPVRAVQMSAVREVDRQQIPMADGCRSLNEWVASRMDVSAETAAEIVRTARLAEQHPELEAALAAGEVSWGRAVVIAPLLADYSIDELACYDIAGIRRLGTRQRRLTADAELRAFAEQYLVVQPSLDECERRVHGRFVGVDGHIVEKALLERADEFRDQPYGEATARTQRQAHALVAMAKDSLDRNDNDLKEGNGGSVAVLVDMDRANGTGGEVGAEVEYGPRVGPNALSELLCVGSVQVIGLTDGRPLVASNSAKAISPAVRRALAHRDGGCVIDGCISRYRLQPHHITERRHGGSHDPANLATLCWYHHHVAIHGRGFRIDATSPPQRRRLLRPRAGADPP